jgi:tRNA A-37 threonylcarbamoyl transferase component Bud32
MGKIKTVISDTCENGSAISQFAEQLLDVFETHGDVLYDERNVIKSFKVKEADAKELVVKRYKRPGLLQRVIYSFFRSSKAERAFRNACELRKRGIDTPHEIAFIEQKKGGLLEYGFYVSESNYNPPIREQLVEPENFNRDMARDFAAFAAELHEKGILHHDLNSTNTLYYYGDEKNSYVFSLIDVNRMYFYPPGRRPSIKSCLKNLTRFTGRMDLFEYVIQCYCDIRKLDGDVAANAIRIKKAHDERWRKRKAFLKRLKQPHSIQSSQ